MDTCEAAIKERLDEVRQRVIEALLEIDNINLQVNPHILARYAKAVGYLENDLYKWQLRARRAKRRFALAQAQANRGEGIVGKAIEATLDDEFAEWEARLSARMTEQLELLEMIGTSRALSPSEARELKLLHRRLIKRLHPDLHPNLPDEAHRFFLIAQAAYESGDVSAMRAVDTATSDYERDDDGGGLAEGELEIELAMAEAQLNIVAERLESLKASRPYILAELLDDPARLSKRKRELEAEIERQREALSAYEAKTAELMEGERR